jgi:hypothetical protein
MKVDLNREVSREEMKPDHQTCEMAFGWAPEGWQWTEDWSTNQGVCKLVKNCELEHAHWSPGLDQMVCPLSEEIFCQDGSYPKSHWDNVAHLTRTYCQSKEDTSVEVKERNIIFYHTDNVDPHCNGQTFEGGKCSLHQWYCNGKCDWEACNWADEAAWYTHHDGEERSFCASRDSCSEGYHVIAQWNEQTQEDELVCLKVQEIEIAQEHTMPSGKTCDEAFGAAPAGFEWGEDWTDAVGVCKLTKRCYFGHDHWSPVLSASVCPETTEVLCPDGSHVRQAWNQATMKTVYFCNHKENMAVLMTERTIAFHDHHIHHIDEHHNEEDLPAWVAPDYSFASCEDDPESILSNAGETCEHILSEFQCDGYVNMYGYERFMFAICPMTCNACPHENVMTVHWTSYSDPMCFEETDYESESFVLNTCYPDVMKNIHTKLSQHIL